MMDVETISDALEELSDERLARSRGKEVRTLKGVRGTPDGEVARIAAAAWTDDRPALPDDEDALSALFGTALEDGLVAIGLLAALVPDAPLDVWEIGLGWLGRTDDLMTADALGWTVLGPALLAAELPISQLLGATKGHAHPAVRRAGLMAGMAMIAVPLEGPCAAPLRARLEARTVQVVEATRSDLLAIVSSAFVRDEAPMVRKALRRLVRTWTHTDAASVVAWADEVRGGLPIIIRDEVLRARRRAAR